MDRPSIRNTLRTTAAAAASLLAARACGLPEAHWAVITTLIVMQSTLGAAWSVSWQRLLGTVLGGVTAAGIVSGFPPGLFPFAAGMLAMGLLCAFVPRQESAYRFAGITFAVVMLPGRTVPIWSVALHRFLEVAIGIGVGMVVTAMTQERAKPGATPPPSGGD